MANYYSSSYTKRRGKRRKLLSLTLTLLIILGVKLVIHNYNPASSIGNDESKTPSTCSNREDTVVISASETFKKPDLAPLPDITSLPKPLVSSDIEEVTAYLDTKPLQIIEARDRLNQMLSSSVNENQHTFVKSQLSNLAQKWLFSRTVFPNDKLCCIYKVKPGDRFKTISDNCKVPYEILMRINNITDPKKLRAGDNIKVINGPFHAKIYRSLFKMDLFLQDTFVSSFPVGLGKEGMETPTGIWLVKKGGKLISPIWTDPVTGKTYQADDPDYPLGARWIGLKGIEGAAKDRTGFAVHGTKSEQQIGMPQSRGCIRLLNEDVILIYDLMMPGQSKIVITD